MKPKLQRNIQQPKPKNRGVRRALNKLRQSSPKPNKYQHPFQAPSIAPGVVPVGKIAPVMAADYALPGGAPYSAYGFAQSLPGYVVTGFPGYPYLSMLATRAEYRAFADTMSTECTREWIKFTSKQDDDTDTADKIKIIEEEFERYGVRNVVGTAVQHDCYFGRAQIFINIEGADRNLPLILDKRTIKKGSLKSINTVEAIWTTPVAYNALDPVAPDFYKPNAWWMLGQNVHASRLLTIMTRELPDMLKPAFNFSGMSLSQLAEPYVDNWLTTRQSVSDLIRNFSTTVLATSMDQVLQGDDDGSDVNDRADLFNATRSNRGLMLLDKEREELIQINTPLSGLSELQAQSQEHMCSVSRTPAIVLTGISPTGLNPSAEGEIRVFYDWIMAQLERYWRNPIDIILKVIQLNKFGEIDPDISFDFVPLYQMTEKELAEIRESNSRSATAYTTIGAVAAEEVRDQLAKDPTSGYIGLDTSVMPELPEQPTEGEDPPGDLNNGSGGPARAEPPKPPVKDKPAADAKRGRKKK